LISSTFKTPSIGTYNQKMVATTMDILDCRMEKFISFLVNLGKMAAKNRHFISGWDSADENTSPGIIVCK